MDYSHIFLICILNVTSTAHLKYVSANSPGEIITPFFFSVRLKFIVIIFPYTKWWNFFILHKAVVYYTSSEVLHHFCHLLLQILRLRALFVAGTHRDMVCALITDRTSAEWSSLSGITEEIKKRAGNRRLSSCHARPFCVTPCGV